MVFAHLLMKRDVCSSLYLYKNRVTTPTWQRMITGGRVRYFWQRTLEHSLLSTKTLNVTCILAGSQQKEGRGKGSCCRVGHQAVVLQSEMGPSVMSQPVTVCLQACSFH